MARPLIRQPRIKSGTATFSHKGRRDPLADIDHDLLIALTSPCRWHGVMWSLTIPTACMKA